MKIAFSLSFCWSLLPMAGAAFGFGGILSSFLTRQCCSIVGLFCEPSGPSAAADDSLPRGRAAEPPGLAIAQKGANARVQEIQDPPANSANSKVGVWYLVLGSGGFLAASICTGNSNVPDGNSYGVPGDALVASGTCQDLWRVVLGPEIYDHSASDRSTPGVWLSTSNAPPYYMFLYYSHYPEEFALLIFQPALAPNEGCSTAIAMELDEIVEEETFQLEGGDVWYSFAGTGGFLAVSNCTRDNQLDNSEVASKDNVGNGSADCEPNNNNIHFLTSSYIHGGNCGHRKPTVYRQSAANETYYVAVRALDTVELLGHLVPSS